MTSTSSVRLLLIEGKRAGLVSFASALKKSGYDIVTVCTGGDAIDSLQERQPHVVIFDSTAMRSSGSRTCRRIRNSAENIPMIHCRAVDVPLDTSAKADIYLEHPFTARKLVNRIKRLIPANDATDQALSVPPLKLYVKKKSISVNGGPEKSLNPKMTELLKIFMSNPDKVISRQMLMKNVWKTDFLGDTRTLDVHIRWIREKIEEDPSKPKLLITVRGKGYKLDLEPLQ